MKKYCDVDKLEKWEGRRGRFEATLLFKTWDRFYQRRALVFADLTDVETGEVIAEWIASTFTESFTKLGNGFKPGRRVAFDARIKKVKNFFPWIQSRKERFRAYPPDKRFRLMMATHAELLPIRKYHDQERAGM